MVRAVQAAWLWETKKRFLVAEYPHEVAFLESWSQMASQRRRFLWLFSVVFMGQNRNIF